MRSHAALVTGLLFAVAALYVGVSRAWFCGYDDFNEAHRAAFADTQQPARIFTTTHDAGYMYRPLTSGLQYVTWTLFQHSALAFRLRNLAMHLVSIAMLYGIIWFLLSSRAIAAAAALLFGVHPMANETVVVAIWTNSTAYALFFGSFFFFLYSVQRLRERRSWALALGASLLCAFIAIFTYEPTIVVFGLMGAYLWLCEPRGQAAARPYLTALAAGIALQLVLFFALRHLFITAGAPFNSPGTIERNAFLYVTGLLLPIDIVLVHALFGTPLPSQIPVASAGTIPLFIAVTAAGAIVVVVLYGIGKRLGVKERRTAAFLGVAIPLTFLPLLLFRDHPSEHDLYPAAALFCALASMVICTGFRSRYTPAIVVLGLAASFAAGTIARNDRVIQCAAVAQRIVRQLPIARWRQGSWDVRLATTPGEQLGEPYGIYNDAGVHTLETEMGQTPGAQEAVQIATSNEQVRVRVVPPGEILQRCVLPHTCFWISSSGGVEDAVTASNARAAQR